VQHLKVTVKSLGWKNSPIPVFPISGGCIFTQAKNEEKWRPAVLSLAGPSRLLLGVHGYGRRQSTWHSIRVMMTLARRPTMPFQ